jgi:hypothetical protein
MKVTLILLLACAAFALHNAENFIDGVGNVFMQVNPLGCGLCEFSLSNFAAGATSQSPITEEDNWTAIKCDQLDNWEDDELPPPVRRRSVGIMAIARTPAKSTWGNDSPVKFGFIGSYTNVDDPIKRGLLPDWHDVSMFDSEPTVDIDPNYFSSRGKATWGIHDDIDPTKRFWKCWFYNNENQFDPNNFNHFSEARSSIIETDIKKCVSRTEYQWMNPDLFSA